jgi:hypothetical protein
MSQPSQGPSLPLHTVDMPIEQPPLEPGVWGFFKRTGSKVLSAMDLIGETFADLLGITEPRYSLYIDDAIEYQKQVRHFVGFYSCSFKKNNPPSTSSTS